MGQKNTSNNTTNAKQFDYHITQEQLRALIKDLGLYEQDGVNGIGEELEAFYLKQFKEELKRRAMLGIEEELKQSQLSEELTSKNGHEKKIDAKYSIGKFHFN
jgi:hypothetical protein